MFIFVPVERKKKICNECGELTYLYARKRCLPCDRKLSPEKHGVALNRTAQDNKSDKGYSDTSKNKSPLKRRKTTGELKLFLQLYAERKGRCEITGQLIPFDVNNFAHILGKKAYPSLRLDPDNIIHVKPEIHHLYDNSSKEKLLEKYPAAIKIYEKKNELRYRYYNPI